MASAEQPTALTEAFEEFERSLATRLKERGERRANIQDLRLQIKQKSDEFQRLNEEILELQKKSTSHGSEEESDETLLAKEQERLQSVTKSLEYWSGISKITRKMLNVKFTARDQDDPTKITMGFLYDKKGAAKKTVMVTDEPSLDNVDAAWEDLKTVNLQSNKTKSKFKERYIENLALNRADVTETHTEP